MPSMRSWLGSGICERQLAVQPSIPRLASSAQSVDRFVSPASFCLLRFLPFPLSGKLMSHCVLLIYSAFIVPIQLSLWYKVTASEAESAA